MFFIYWFQMSVIYNLLERFRLEHYYAGCLAIGVTDERDLVDSVTAEDLDTMGRTRRLSIMHV